MSQTIIWKRLFLNICWKQINYEEHPCKKSFTETRKIIGKVFQSLSFLTTHIGVLGIIFLLACYIRLILTFPREFLVLILKCFPLSSIFFIVDKAMSCLEQNTLLNGILTFYKWFLCYNRNFFRGSWIFLLMSHSNLPFKCRMQK